MKPDLFILTYLKAVNGAAGWNLYAVLKSVPSVNGTEAVLLANRSDNQDK